MKPFADTNILVYAATLDDEHKQILARSLVARPYAQALTISTQVLGEAFNVLTLRKRWAASEALAAVQVFATLRVYVPSAETVMRGLGLAARHKLSPWDALIVQAAVEAGCDTLFSEDLQAGRRFGDLVVVNPFEAQAHEPLAGAAWPAAAKPPRARAARK